MRACQALVSPPYQKIRCAFSDHPITVWAGAILLRFYVELMGRPATLAPLLVLFAKTTDHQILP